MLSDPVQLDYVAHADVQLRDIRDAEEAVVGRTVVSDA
jgi:hypothetical protein